MGQYYRPIFLKEDRKTISAFAYSHKVGQGLKLMEHSYIDNPLCNAVINEIIYRGGANLVWAGDYADEEPTILVSDLWMKAVAERKTTLSLKDFEKGLGGRETLSENLYHLSADLVDDNGTVINKGAPEIKYNTEYPNVNHLINEDKKEIVSLYDLVSLDGYTINPLPLLTAEGNGRGGGDYDGTNMHLIGSWARDFIVAKSIRYNERADYEAAGYTFITPIFAEPYSIVSTAKSLLKVVQVGACEGAFSKEVKKKLLSSITELKKALKPTKKETEKEA